jgi:hypothetical protein
MRPTMSAKSKAAAAAPNFDEIKSEILDEVAGMSALKETDGPMFTSTQVYRNSQPTPQSSLDLDPDVPQKADPVPSNTDTILDPDIDPDIKPGEPENLFTSRVKLFDPSEYSDGVNGILKKYPYGYDTNSMLFAVSITPAINERGSKIRVVILSTKESRPYYIHKLNKLILLYILYFKSIYFDRGGREQFFYVGTLDNQIVPQGRYGLHQDVLTTQYLSKSQEELLYAFTAATQLYRDQLASLFRDENGSPYTYKSRDIATFGAIQYAIKGGPMANTTFRNPDGTRLLSTLNPMTDVDIATSTYVNFIAHHTTPRNEYLARPRFIDTVLSYINILKSLLGSRFNDDAVNVFTDLALNYTQPNHTNMKEYNMIFDAYKAYNRALRRLLFILYDNDKIDETFKSQFEKLITDFKRNPDTKIIFHNTNVVNQNIYRKTIVNLDEELLQAQEIKTRFLLKNNYIGRPFDERQIRINPKGSQAKADVETFFVDIDKSCVSDCIYYMNDPIIQAIEVEVGNMISKTKQPDEYIVAPDPGMRVGGKRRKSRSKTKQKRNKRRNTKKKYYFKKGRKISQRRKFSQRRKSKKH